MNVARDYGDLRISGPARLEADLVIIGSGAGGAVVAATAVEHGQSVLVLEEGPYIPAAKAPARLTKSLEALWRHAGLTAAYGSPPVTYAEGRCVGGSTEINSAIFQRTPDDLLTEWEQRYCIHHFGAQDLAPHYDWAADVVNASPPPQPMGPPSEILARAGQAMDWQVKTLDRGLRSCVGTNMCSLGCPTGGKQSMSSTLIPRILDAGSRVLAAVKVKRLLFKGRRVTGVEATGRDSEGRTHLVQVSAKNFFLCAGAIQSPALLQLSGLHGPIGQHLRLHPTLKALTFFDETIDAHKHRLPLVAITEFMPEIRLGGSIFTPETFGLSLAEDWSQRASYTNAMGKAAIYYVMARGQGYGRIRAMPNGAAPLVTYKLDANDWQGLSQGLSRLGQALLRSGAKHVLPSVIGHQGWRNEHQAADAFDQPLPHKLSQLMTIHLFGSCPMGEHEALCAADSFGRVHGTDNLYLGDASLIPEAPGVNPQATVMALARRNALHMMEKNP